MLDLQTLTVMTECTLDITYVKIKPIAFKFVNRFDNSHTDTFKAEKNKRISYSTHIFQNL